jgi:hypothetical protein
MPDVFYGFHQSPSNSNDNILTDLSILTIHYHLAEHSITYREEEA